MNTRITGASVPAAPGYRLEGALPRNFSEQDEWCAVRTLQEDFSEKSFINLRPTHKL